MHDNTNLDELDHRVVVLTSPIDGAQIHVDRKIAKLIKKLWEKGIYTNFSCQGEPSRKRDYRVGLAYISMPHTTKSHYLLEQLLRHYDSFVIGIQSEWVLEMDHHAVQGPRILIRFPQEEIRSLTRFVDYWM